MTRTLRALAIVVILLLSARLIQAQTPTQPNGPPAPGPVNQQIYVPVRDATVTAAPKGTGRIRGRVVAAETGSPLPRAQLRLTGTTTGGQPPAMQVTNTDGDGRYEFASLPAARYSLTVSRSGYVTLQFGQQRPFEPGKPLTLADGEVADKIDFALPRGGVIAGKLTDDTGEAVAGVRMQAQRYQYMPGGQRRLVTGNTGPGAFNIMTDDLGQFRVYGLMPGSYVLSAIPWMNGTMMVLTTNGTSTSSTRGADANDGYATTYFPGTMNVDEAQTITVGLGQEASAFFALVSARMARVSGVIRNSQGDRLAGRWGVSLRTAYGVGGFTTNGTTSVAPDGSFTIANVPPGEHYLDVRPMPGPPPSPGAAAQPTEEEYASVPVSVSGQDINGLVITTGPGATATGRLIFDGNSPRPQIPHPLRVGVSPADPFAQSMMTVNTPDNGVVDESGRFQIRGVNGQVLFRTGAQGWNMKSVMLNGVDITDTPFDAKPSSSVTGLEITLTDRQTSLSGSVRNPLGETVKDFVVAIFPAALADGVVPTRFTRTIRPDQQGRYQVRGLPPGDYVAVAVESLEQGGEWDPSFQQEMKPRGRIFRLSDTQSLTMDLTLVR